MKYEPKVATKKGFLGKLTQILLAVFLSTTIFAALQTAFNTIGIILALIINLSVAIQLIKKGHKGHWRSVIGWSIIWTMIIGAILVFGILGYAKYVIDSTI